MQMEALHPRLKDDDDVYTYLVELHVVGEKKEVFSARVESILFFNMKSKENTTCLHSSMNISGHLIMVNESIKWY